MEAVKQWAVCLCSAVLAAGVIVMLAPEGGTKKILKTIISVFILCCMISPLTGFSDIEFSVSDRSQEAVQTGSDSLQEVINRQTLNAGAKAIEQLASEALAEEKINAESVSVNMDIAEDNSIVINQLDVVLDNAPDCEKAEEIIKRKMGLACRITVRESGEMENERNTETALDE